MLTRDFTMDAPTCLICKELIRPNTRFCAACGSPIPSLAAPEPTAPLGTNGTGPPYQYCPLRPGQEINSYRVLRQLSKGGMGAVYLAEDLITFGHIVVIKGMLDYFDPADEQAVRSAQQRFEAEAQTLASLRHTGIPQIHTYFRDGPHNYIVMEYIEGQDLAQGLAQQQGQANPEADVIRWGIALCKILEYLARHQPPVVHHDIKPSNIILDANTGEVRLVDFGTAKARLVHQLGGGVGVQKTSVYGTQGYAAPEQYRGDSEPRSDIYALAATLYHLATSDDPSLHPFHFPLIKQIGAFGQVLERALARDPEQRPAPVELRQHLEALAALPPIQAPDGTSIHNELELAAWGEANWDAAASWLYRDDDTLPRQVAQLWGKTQLSNQLRACVSTHPNNWGAGLDAALALCDPSGFGSALPAVTVAPARLDYGALQAQVRNTRTLEIRNTGRRFVHIQVAHPAWIDVESMVDLDPGNPIIYEVTTDTGKVKLGGSVRDTIRFNVGTQTLGQVPVSAHISRLKTLWYQANNVAKRRSTPLTAKPVQREFHPLFRLIPGFLAIVFAVLCVKLIPGNPLLVLGGAACLIAYVGYIVQAIRAPEVLKKLVWVLGFLIVPGIVILSFTFKHWRRAKVPFFTGLCGMSLIILSLATAVVESDVTVTSQSGDFQIIMPSTWSTWEEAYQAQLPEGANMAVADPPFTTLMIASRNQTPSYEASLRDNANTAVKAIASEFQTPSVSEPVDLRLGDYPAVQYTIRGRFTKAMAAEMVAQFQNPSFLSRSIDPAKRQALMDELSKENLEDLDWTFVVTAVAGRGKLYLLILSTTSSDFEQRTASLRKVIGSFTLLSAPPVARVSGQLNLRRSPDATDNQNIVQVLRSGIEVVVLEDQDIEIDGQKTHWARVRVQSAGTEGWVNAQYLKITAP